MNSFDFRQGDEPSPLGPLRLTVGGLAEIVTRLETPDVSALAQEIRHMTPQTGRYIAAALLRPAGGAVRVDDLTDAQVADLMPAAARCIKAALAGSQT